MNETPESPAGALPERAAAVPAVAAHPLAGEPPRRPGGGAAAAAAVPLAIVALLLAGAALVLGVTLLQRSDDAERRLEQAHEDEQLRDQRNSQRELRLGALERQWQEAQGDGDVSAAGGLTIITSPELRRRREQLAMLDIERLVEQAQLQLRLGTSTASVVEALEAADARLARLASPAALRVQTALRHDLARLRAAPDTDRTAQAARLDPLFAAVAHWPASADPLHPSAHAPGTAGASVPQRADAAAGAAAQTGAHPVAQGAVQGTAQTAAQTAAQNTAQRPAPPAPESAGARLRAWLAREFGDYLRIREVDTPDAILLAPAQQQLLRDRFRLGVLDLRQAILARDATAVRAEAAALDALLGRYFDPNDAEVAAAQAQLREVAATAVPGATVSLDETLAALQAARAAEG